MKNQFSFEFTQQIGDNFTPSAKINQFARINGYKTDYRYFTLHIIIDGITYTYHHYDITQISADRERVTIYLEEV